AEFGHFLLYEYTAPELENIPVVVSERVGQASALVGIEPQVGDDRPINLLGRSEPSVGLICEPVFVVVDPRGGKRALSEIPDLMPLRRALAGDQVGLVVAVEMDFVGPVAELLTLLELVGDVRVAGRRHEGREPVEPG